MEREKASVIKRLSDLPGVGEKAAEGMFLLGVRSLEDLRGVRGEDMYAKLRERNDFYAEPCMLNQLKIAVKMAEDMDR